MSVGVVNKQTGDRIPTAGMPAIDNALSATSTNPVQNAIITAALANKQDKTDNSLQTTDKTVVGAVNELKSGLTNYEATTNAALSVPDGSGVNLFIPSNYETFDLTGEGNYRYGHSFNSGEYYVVSNNTVGIYYRIVKEDLSDLGTSVPITSTPQKVTIPSGYIMWVFSNNQSTLPNACVSKYSTAYVEYIPSVESRIEAVESGLTSYTKLNETPVSGTYRDKFNYIHATINALSYHDKVASFIDFNGTICRFTDISGSIYTYVGTYWSSGMLKSRVVSVDSQYSAIKIVSIDATGTTVTEENSVEDTKKFTLYL